MAVAIRSAGRELAVIVTDALASVLRLSLTVRVAVNSPADV
jgi:hypothetical protein